MKKATLEKVLKALDYNTQGITLESALPLYPWLVADIAYSLFTENMLPLSDQLRHRTKLALKEWRLALNDFYKQFFGKLNEDEMCEVTDLMDGLEDEVSNDIVRLRVSVHKQVEHDDLQVRKVIANGYVCIASLLTAQDGYRALFESRYKVNGVVRCNSRLGSIDRAIRCGAKFIGLYAASHGIYNVECGEDILNNREALGVKCASWTAKQILEN